MSSNFFLALFSTVFANVKSLKHNALVRDLPVVIVTKINFVLHGAIVSILERSVVHTA